MNPISAIVIIHNEAHRIEACLRDLRPHVAELIVFDQLSTDGTIEIVKRLHNEDVIDVLRFHPCYDAPEVSRPEALEIATHQWCLILDADEYLTEDLKRALPVMLADHIDFYHLRRVTTVGGGMIEDAHHRRLFKKNFVRAMSYANLGYYAHSSVEINRGTRQARPEFVAIRSDKTSAEQAIDSERSDRLMAMRNEPTAVPYYDRK